MAGFESSKIVSLVPRIVTFVVLLISLIILVTVSTTIKGPEGSVKYSFTYFNSFRYLLSAIIIGIVYTLMQIALFILHLKTKEEGLLLLDFYGDKVITFLLASAAGAGFGASIDLKKLLDPDGVLLSTYFAKVDASASLLLFAAICTAVSSVFSSHALPRVQMAATAGSRVACLALRVFANILMFISLIVLCTNVETWSNGEFELKFEFVNVKSYQYMLSVIVIGIVYMLLQTALSIYNMTMKSDGLLLLDFYGDKFVSYLLVTGAAAGFGATVDGKVTFDSLGIKVDAFFAKSNASASLLLLAFVCAAALSIISSFALPKSI